MKMTKTIISKDLKTIEDADVKQAYLEMEMVTEIEGITHTPSQALLKHLLIQVDELITEVKALKAG